MKKLIIALLIAVMVPAFAACGESESTDKDTDSSVSTVETEKEDKDEEKDSDETADETTEESTDDEEADETTEESTDDEKTDDTADISSAEGVDPDLKKAVDDYEVLMDDFIAFMEPYKDMDMENADEEVVGQFFTDYMTFFSEHEAEATAFSEIDVEALEGADKAYYDEVTARVEQKAKDAGLEEDTMM